MIPIGSGRAPFWLDETTYGYIRQRPASSDSQRRELALASTADDMLHSLFTEFDLQDAWFTSLAEKRNTGETVRVYGGRIIARANSAPDAWDVHVVTGRTIRNKKR